MREAEGPGSPSQGRSLRISKRLHQLEIAETYGGQTIRVENQTFIVALRQEEVGSKERKIAISRLFQKPRGVFDDGFCGAVLDDTELASASKVDRPKVFFLFLFFPFRRSVQIPPNCNVVMGWEEQSFTLFDHNSFESAEAPLVNDI